MGLEGEVENYNGRIFFFILIFFLGGQIGLEDAGTGNGEQSNAK